MIELSVIAKEKYEFILIDMNSKSNIKHEVRTEEILQTTYTRLFCFLMYNQELFVCA